MTSSNYLQIANGLGMHVELPSQYIIISLKASFYRG